MAYDYRFAFFDSSEWANTANAEYFRVAYHFRTEERSLKDKLPAVAGQFLLFMHGKGALHFADGRIAHSGLCYFITPMTQAAEYHLEGPLHAVGIGLTELGWASLTGLNVDKVGNTTIDAHNILGAECQNFAEETAQLYNSGDITPHQVADRMREFLSPRFVPLEEKQKQLIRITRAWATQSLNPGVQELYAALPYSPRQIQRLVSRYFGQPPVQLAKRMRASFVASVMNHNGVTPQLDAEIGESYFDQPHLIRDVKQVAGRTPSKIGEPKASVLSDILNPQGYINDAHAQKLDGTADD